MNPSIYILSQPVQSGKTTALMNWIRTQKGAAGILTPDVNDKRMLYDISTQSFTDFETDGKEAVLEIGKFRFSKKAFEKAQQLLLEAAGISPDWLLVDEVGKLELQNNSGLEPVVSQLIEMYKAGINKGRLLLVIRDSLLKGAINHYHLENAKIVNAVFFTKALNGIVMCGGQSSRMGTDKAMINYHGEPQFINLYKKMKPFMSHVFLSCNHKQDKIMSAGYPFIIDSNQYSDAGPMTGLLSAFHQFHDQAFIVVGCDYPLINDEIIVQLMNLRDDTHQAVCYHDPETGFDEPLVTIYESSCHVPLESFYKAGHTSLQQFLKSIKTKRIQPPDFAMIRSIDTMPASEQLNRLLQNRAAKSH